MLRASIADTNADLSVVIEGADRDDGAVPNAQLLLRYAEAVIARDGDRIEEGIQGILSVLGEEALVDAAAVCAQFNAITRVADATGVQLDPALERNSAGIRDQLGLNAFNTTVE